MPVSMLTWASNSRKLCLGRGKGCGCWRKVWLLVCVERVVKVCEMVVGVFE